MDKQISQTKIIEELKLLSEHKFDELYNLIHEFRVNLE